ncbi:outer membrane assembly protein AsmA [Lonsdalea populi]|uniref:outer membrane assembly protein AsmA n=1 Tax=Lonsdalea populi TaxID=1172565 RepID=UPI000DCA6C7F|nr:outer membrane assembly protein AsmA [Lonsdalea populi]RAT71346.1 outer membrane assembly protein AsmA [Lonsdalea populi]RAT72398.1 outer membrane assembly protein AsmA [Lonsdalea populi]RAT76687.1 outer membrane assembly protein AsmA [Lonsdalea populi]RAT78535.1 outer membrane assembly protein AsmA [Lonsdalea populi]
MKRLFTALVILLVVLAAGMSALVVLINPNDFRGYMTRQVAARSGYQLTLDGDLRWHVWPQLSILSGGMSLSAPGAQAPMVSAENMRLDVKLWPLLSHRLEVKQVMLKGAVVRLTPESQPKKTNQPIAPPGGTETDIGSGWRFDIGRIEVTDSLLILQQESGEQLNLRDINLRLTRGGPNEAQLTLSTRINRDQRDLSLSGSSVLDMREFPQRVSARIDRLDYQLQGVGLPTSGITGTGAMQVDYQRQPEKITVSQFALSANQSQLSGTAAYTSGTVPDYRLDLRSEQLDLDMLLGLTKNEDDASGAEKTPAVKPVISGDAPPQQVNSGLRNFTAHIALQADALIYRSVKINQFSATGINQRGKVTVAELSGRVGDGHFSLPGTLDIDASPAINVQPKLENVELSDLMRVLTLPETSSGTFTMQGKFSGDSLTVPAMLSKWQGSAAMHASRLRLYGLNIPRMIQQAVERNSNGVRGQSGDEHFTEMQQVTGQARLNAGKLRMYNLDGRSHTMSIGGEGLLDLPAQSCDINLSVQVIEGWQGDDRVVQLLKNTRIPFRLYGPFGNLSYQLPVDQMLRKRLQDELKQQISDWSKKNQPD